MLPKNISVKIASLAKNRQLRQTLLVLTTKNVLVSLLSFLVIYAASKLLRPEVFGTYKYILSIGAIVYIFSLSGAGKVVLRSTARGYDGTLSLLYHQTLRLGVFASSILLIISFYYYLAGNVNLALSFALIAFIQPFIKASVLYRSFLNGKKQFKLLALDGIFVSIAVSAITIITMVYMPEPLWLVAAKLLVEASIAIVLYKYVLKKFVPDDAKPDVDSFNYSQHQSVLDGLTQAASRLEQIIIFQILGPAAVSLYSFSNAPVGFLFSLRKVLMSIVAPLYSNRHAGLFSGSLEKSLLLICCLIPFVWLYLVFSENLMRFLFPEFPESIVITQILVFGLFGIPTFFFTEVMDAIKAKRELYIRSITVPLIKVILMMILTYTHGMVGFAVAIAVSSNMNLLISGWLSFRAAKRLGAI